MKNRVNSIIAAVLSLAMVFGIFTPAGISTVFFTKVSAGGGVIYSENFSDYDTSSSEETVKALGWTICEGLKTNTAKLTISQGKLIFDNLGSSTNDSYFGMLTDEYMKDVCKDDYSISFKLKYTEAEANDRYVGMLYNYNTFHTYNSVHIRVAGNGNNQSRVDSVWANYEAIANTEIYSLRNTNENTLIKRVFGENYDPDKPSLLEKEMTVRIAISKEKGPNVYVNDVLVSECIDPSKLAETEAFAIALKISPKIKGEIDDIIVWKGLEEAPNDKTIDYTPSTAGFDITVLSANLLVNSPSSRFNYIKTFFAETKPDIVGLQEINNSFNSLLTYFESEENGSYKTADKRITGTSTVNMAPILYNSERFELVEGDLAHGAHLLEARWQKTYSKIISWAILREKTTGRRILAMNTHFAVYTSAYTGFTSADAVEWRKDNARYAIELLGKIREIYGPIPAFFTGDFNMQNHETAHRILLSEFTDSQIYAPDAINFLASYNSQFSSNTHVTTEKYPIDRVYITKGDWTVNSHQIVRSALTAKMTDHYPVIVKLSLNEVAAPKASHKDGMYDGTQKVTLSTTKTEGADIYYTTDGSDPTKNGKLYTGAIEINGNVRLRAITEYYGKTSEELTVNFRSKNSPELLITEVVKNTPGTDMLEAIELINISDHCIDLSDYKFFYVSSDSNSALSAIKNESMVINMQISNVRGKYVLAAGQTAIIWVIFTDVYTKDSGAGLITEGYNDSPSYNIDKMRELYQKQTGMTIPESTLIVALDRTCASYFRNGKNTNLTNSFNLGNSTAARICLTYTNNESAADAIAAIDLPLITKEGSYNFIPTSDGKLTYDGFREKSYSYGLFDEKQHSALKSIMETVPSDFDSLLVKTTTDTTTSAETTKIPETTPQTSETTQRSPETTSAPTVTTEPETTRAPEMTEKPKETETETAAVTENDKGESTEETKAPESTRSPETSSMPKDETTKSPDKETGKTTSVSSDETKSPEDSSDITDTIQNETENEVSSNTESLTQANTIKLPEEKNPIIDTILIIGTSVLTAACVIVGIVLIVRFNKNKMNN